jgi:hypothetical protein
VVLSPDNPSEENKLKSPSIMKKQTLNTISAAQKLASIEFVVILVGCVVLFSMDATHKLTSFFVGSAVSSANVIFLAYSWHLIFKKKLIALSVMTIVIKYLLLITMLYYLVVHKVFDLVWLVVGISTIVLTFVLYGTVELLISTVRKLE